MINSRDLNMYTIIFQPWSHLCQSLNVYLTLEDFSYSSTLIVIGRPLIGVSMESSRGAGPV